MSLALRLFGERDGSFCIITRYSLAELRSSCQFLRSLLDFGAATAPTSRPDGQDEGASSDVTTTDDGAVSAVLEVHTGSCRASLAGAVLHFLIRGPMDAPLEVDGSNAAELLGLADLWCLDAVKAHVVACLRRSLCNGFRKPTAGSCAVEAVPQVAVLARQALDYGIGDADGSLKRLYDECVAWMATWAARTWPTRTFASLQRTIQDDVIAAARSHVDVDSAPAVLSACRQLSGVPSVAWARRIEEMRADLTSYTLSYIWGNFPHICARAGLRQDRSECWGALLEELRNHVEENPDPDAAVRVLPRWASITRALLYGTQAAAVAAAAAALARRDGAAAAPAGGAALSNAARRAGGGLLLPVAMSAAGASWLGEDEASQMQDLYDFVRSYCVRHLPLVVRCAAFRALPPAQQQAILLIAQEGICIVGYRGGGTYDGLAVAAANGSSAADAVEPPLLQPTQQRRAVVGAMSAAAAAEHEAGAAGANRSSAAWVITLGGDSSPATLEARPRLGLMPPPPHGSGRRRHPTLTATAAAVSFLAASSPSMRVTHRSPGALAAAARSSARGKRGQAGAQAAAAQPLEAPASAAAALLVASQPLQKRALGAAAASAEPEAAAAKVEAAAALAPEPSADGQMGRLVGLLDGQAATALLHGPAPAAAAPAEAEAEAETASERGAGGGGGVAATVTEVSGAGGVEVDAGSAVTLATTTTEGGVDAVAAGAGSSAEADGASATGAVEADVFFAAAATVGTTAAAATGEVAESEVQRPASLLQKPHVEPSVGALLGDAEIDGDIEGTVEPAATNGASPVRREACGPVVLGCRLKEADGDTDPDGSGRRGTAALDAALQSSRAARSEALMPAAPAGSCGPAVGITAADGQHTNSPERAEAVLAAPFAPTAFPSAAIAASGCTTAVTDPSGGDQGQRAASSPESGAQPNTRPPPPPAAQVVEAAISVRTSWGGTRSRAPQEVSRRGAIAAAVAVARAAAPRPSMRAVGAAGGMTTAASTATGAGRAAGGNGTLRSGVEGAGGRAASKMAARPQPRGGTVAEAEPAATAAGRAAGAAAANLRASRAVATGATRKAAVAKSASRGGAAAGLVPAPNSVSAAASLVDTNELTGAGPAADGPSIARTAFGIRASNRAAAASGVHGRGVDAAAPPGRPMGLRATLSARAVGPPESGRVPPAAAAKGGAAAPRRMPWKATPGRGSDGGAGAGAAATAASTTSAVMPDMSEPGGGLKARAAAAPRLVSAADEPSRVGEQDACDGASRSLVSGDGTSDGGDRDATVSTMAGGRARAPRNGTVGGCPSAVGAGGARRRGVNDSAAAKAAVAAAAAAARQPVGPTAKPHVPAVAAAAAQQRPASAAAAAAVATTKQQGIAAASPATAAAVAGAKSRLGGVWRR